MQKGRNPLQQNKDLGSNYNIKHKFIEQTPYIQSEDTYYLNTNS